MPGDKFEMKYEQLNDNSILNGLEDLTTKDRFVKALEKHAPIVNDKKEMPLLGPDHMKISHVDHNGIDNYVIAVRDWNEEVAEGQEPNYINVGFVKGFGNLKNFVEDYAKYTLGQGTNFEFTLDKGVSFDEFNRQRESLIFSRKMDLMNLKSETLQAAAEQALPEIEQSIQDLENLQIRHNTILDELKDDKSRLRRVFNKNPQQLTDLERNFYKIYKMKIKDDLAIMAKLEQDLTNSIKPEIQKAINDDPNKTNAAAKIRVYREVIVPELEVFEDEASKTAFTLNDVNAYNRFSQNTDRIINFPVFSEKNAARYKQYYEEIHDEKQKINMLLHSADLHKIQSDQQETLHAYLQDILNGNTPAQKFVPKEEYKEDMHNLLTLMPELGQYIDVTRTKKNNTMNNNPIDTVIIAPGAIDTYSNGRKNNGNLLDKVTPSQLTDWIDQSENLNAGQKERLKTVAGLAFLSGILVLGRKTVKGAYKALTGKATEADRGRLAAGAGLFGTMYVTKGNIIDVKGFSETIGGRFSDAGLNMSDEEETYTKGFTSMHILFKDMTYAGMNVFVTEDGGIMKLDYDGLNTYLKTEKASGKSKLSDLDKRIDILQKLKKEDSANLFHLAMSGMGFSKEMLKNPDNAAKTYNEKASQAIVRVGEMYDYMQTHNYTRRNPQIKDKLKESLANGKPSFEQLDKMGAFEKDETLSDQSGLEGQVNALTTLTDPDSKKYLLQQARRVENELRLVNAYNGKFEIVEENGIVYLQTYGKKTQLDLQNSRIQYGAIQLNTLTTYQTLKAANLTNRLQELFAGKATKTYATKEEGPFYISNMGNLLFDQQHAVDWDKVFSKQGFNEIVRTISPDVQAVNLDKVSPSLEEQKKQYTLMLNSMTGRKQ